MATRTAHCPAPWPPPSWKPHPSTPSASPTSSRTASAEEALRWALETFSPKMYIAASFQKTSSVTVAHGDPDRPRRPLLLPRHRRALPRDLRDARTGSRSATGSVPPLQLDHARAAGRAARRPALGAATPTPAAASARSSRCAPRCRPSTAGSRASAARTRRPAPRRPSSRWDKRFGLWKLNPLADWSEKDVWRYISEHDIPYNPLHDQGYPSIGCTHCTRKPARGRGCPRGPLGRHRRRPSAVFTAELTV